MSVSKNEPRFAPVEEVLADLRAGRRVVILDDEDRENEGDLACAAEFVTPEMINFMATHGRGLICLPMTADRLDELQIPPMVQENTARRGTAFCVSIESRRDVTTGISAADRAASYGLPRQVIDGNDADIVYSTARDAVAKARSGGGPSLIECLTYRHSGHSRADPAKYRPKEELEEWMKRDPVALYRARLLASGIAEAKLAQIETESMAKLEKATETAKASPTPALESAMTDVWADGGNAWRN